VIATQEIHRLASETVRQNVSIAIELETVRMGFV
jgi:hypothetical protein